jgi:hypothetical protein
MDVATLAELLRETAQHPAADRYMEEVLHVPPPDEAVRLSSPAIAGETMTTENTVSPTLRKLPPHQQINGSAARIAGGKPELLDLPEVPIS